VEAIISSNLHHVALSQKNGTVYFHRSPARVVRRLVGSTSARAKLPRNKLKDPSRARQRGEVQEKLDV
jgi:hypothetical protein